MSMDTHLHQVEVKSVRRVISGLRILHSGGNWNKKIMIKRRKSKEDEESEKGLLAF